MFSFFKKKPAAPATPTKAPELAADKTPHHSGDGVPSAPPAAGPASTPASPTSGDSAAAEDVGQAAAASAESALASPAAGVPGRAHPAGAASAPQTPDPLRASSMPAPSVPSSASAQANASTGPLAWLRNPFARPATAPEAAPASAPDQPAEPTTTAAARPEAIPVAPAPLASPAPPPPPAAPFSPAASPAQPLPPPAQANLPEAARVGWMDRLRGGLRKTSASIATVFTGARIDDALYDELEEALLMADTGVKATQHLLLDLKRRVKETRTTDPAAVKGLLADALTDLLSPLEKSLVIGEFTPTVIMVAGVNGAGKTTSIGKLTRHLAQSGASVLLAAADTFRAAAREQLGVWADRNTVEIISQEGGDPAAVSYDAVTAGRARRKDVVLVDTAGRLPTQLHLMEELRKIKRTIVKAGNAPGPAGMGVPPHEILLVIDGNTGQNALAQVRAFDDALQLTGLIVTKLDGTAKGGVLAAIAQERPLPVYFIGVGEKLEDLETFSAREFAQALLT